MLFDGGRWLLCAPTFYDVTYEINPWMKVERTPERSRAARQWQELHHTIIRFGGWVEYVEPVKGQPDMVFTANAGLVRGARVVLARFRHRERQGEEQPFREWFERHGYQVHTVTKGAFEGEGDALLGGERLFAGCGFRTDRAVYEEVAQHLMIADLVLCELVDPYFYHLDTCFCPLNERQALFVRSAFAPDTVRRMEQHLELWSVPEEEAHRFACNAVIVNRQVIIPAGCPQTAAHLDTWRYTAHQIELSEFIKAGGAAKCLSLKIPSLQS